MLKGQTPRHPHTRRCYRSGGFVRRALLLSCGSNQEGLSGVLIDYHCFYVSASGVYVFAGDNEMREILFSV